MRTLKLNFVIMCVLTACLGTLVVSSIAGEPCVVPDNGSGTVTLPPMGCEFTSPDEVFEIIDGLPPGTTIELEGILKNFICCSGFCPGCSLPIPPTECEAPGGSLGGHGHCFEAALQLQVSGTGDLTGFNRTLWVPVFCEVHTGPRNPGDPVQTFPNMMYRLQGELFGDPDFCTFRIIGGTDYGLPGPGQTTLTQLPSGDFAVDSFFDITYQIEFEGCPGSQLEGYMGTTTATIRMETGFEPVCGPTEDGTGCEEVDCPVEGDECQPTCVTYDPETGYTTVIECQCRHPEQCHVDPGSPSSCVLPDNGTGTATLPPIGCEYTSPEEYFMILDGLPPGSTIELDGIWKDFICCQMDCPLCTMPPLPPGQCETPGGSLGGHAHCFNSTLDLTVSGTGSLTGFNRHLSVPVFAEVHTGPRTPGNPVQQFSAQIYHLQGELFGDPDFCEFRITGGSDFGLPSPGQTTLTQLPSGDFAVDSFFDINYQIEFEGCPGSVLDGYKGTTTATIRMITGGDYTPPSCVGGCPDCEICFESTTTNPDGTIEICCNCLPDADLNKDDIVDFKDFAIFAVQWLSTR